MIICPACGRDDAKTVNTRNFDGGWKRTKSCACGIRYLTVEIVLTKTKTLYRCSNAIQAILSEIQDARTSLSNFTDVELLGELTSRTRGKL